MSGYWIAPVKMRANDVTAVDTSIDGTTAGYTYDWVDRPSGCYEVDPNAEYVLISGYHGICAAAGVCGRFKLYGWADRGNAEILCDVSTTAGPFFVNDSTVTLYIDKYTTDATGHVFDISLHDNDNDRVAKMILKNAGYKYLWPNVIDLTAGSSMNFLIRTF